MTDGTATYGQYVEDELAAQSARKASLEQRAVTVITSSGTLATLLFGLAALSTTRHATFALPQSAGNLLVVSLGCFVVAATCALAANVPLFYQAVRPDGIRARLNESPAPSATDASREVALTRLKVLESAKSRNKTKAWLLIGGLAFEVIAVLFVALAIRLVIAA